MYLEVFTLTRDVFYIRNSLLQVKEQESGTLLTVQSIQQTISALQKVGFGFYVQVFKLHVVLAGSASAE